MDRADTQSVVVDAESWQKALQAARSARGERGPISGFSIELLDEGYRAVDPLARLRYDVKRASEAAADGPTAKPPTAHAPPRPAAKPAAAVTPPPAPAGNPSAASAAPAATAVHAPAAPAAPQAPAVTPLPEATVRTEPLSEVRADSSLELELIPDPSGPFPAQAPPAPPRPPPPPPHTASGPPPPPAAAALDAGPVPPTQVIFKREHDPTERLPLTYREYVFTVARGVDEVAAERLLRAQLDQVRASIMSSRPGKFVQLAVFDVVFQGRPPIPPLATLSWKDWIGEPAVAFPRRTPTNHSAPPIAAQPVISVAPPPPAPPPSIAAAFHRPAPPSPPPPPPAPQVLAAPVFPPPVVAAPGPFVAPVPPPAVVAPGPASAPPAAPAVPAPAAAPVFPTPPVVEPNPVAASLPSNVVGDPFAPSAAPLPAGVPVPAAEPPAAPRRPSVQQRLTPTPSRPSLRPVSSGRRATGDELIANLFEAMHELHFTRDVIEGGDYVLALALEMIPSRCGIVHLYDIDRREFVVANVSGPATEGLLNRRHPEGEPLLAAAMRKRRAVVLADAANEEGGKAERFDAIGGATSVVCSPVLKGGRFLGAIEIVNPTDGIPYTDHEGNAVDYISEQFAEFVAAHGMQLDAARITRSIPPAAP